MNIGWWGGEGLGRFPASRAFFRRQILRAGVAALLFSPGGEALAQPAKRPENRIAKQVIKFSVIPANPAKAVVEPGDTLKFVYKVCADEEEPVTFEKVEVKLSIRAISDSLPSMLHDSFTPVSAFVSRAKTGVKKDTTYSIRIDDQNETVTYVLGNFGRDTLATDNTKVSSDTLGFEFTYRVRETLPTVTCIRVRAGIDAEMFSTDIFDKTTRIPYGLFPATINLETKSDINWSTELDPPPPPKGYDPNDKFRLLIKYGNTGNVKDAIYFYIQIPDDLNYSNLDTASLTRALPSPAIIHPSTTASTLVIFDNDVAPGNQKVIALPVSLNLVSIRSQPPRFTVKMDARCVADSTISKGFPVDLLDLLLLSKSAAPAAVAPGDTINYVLTFRRQRFDVPLDTTIRLEDFLPPGVAQIVNATPAPASISADNRRIVWQFPGFPADSVIKFGAVLKPDFYGAVVQSPDSVCRGVDFINRTTINLAPGSIMEGVVGNNSSLTVTNILPLGDVLKIDGVTIANPRRPGAVLPGDTVLFAVRYSNPSSFAASSAFTLIDKLPGLQYFSGPLPGTLSPLAAYFSQDHTVRLVLPGLGPGEAGTLAFQLRVRDDFTICEAETLINRAAVTLQGVDCLVDNNAATDSIIIAPAQTSLFLNAAGPGVEIDPNTETILLLEYGSAASSRIPIRNVVVRDTLAPGMEFVRSEPPPASFFFPFLEWNFPALNPGQTGAIRLIVKAPGLQPCRRDTLVTHAGISSAPAACALRVSPEAKIALSGTDDLIEISAATITPQPGASLAARDRVSYSYTITNLSPLPAQSLVITDTLPSRLKFELDQSSISSEGMLNNGVITWSVLLLNPNASTTVSFAGNVSEHLNCQPDSLVNILVLRSDPARFPDCSAELRRTSHILSATPEDLQPKLLLVSFEFGESARPDGLVEANEPMTLRLTYRNDNSFKFENIAFSDMVAVLGAEAVSLAPRAGNPVELAAGAPGDFYFSFTAPPRVAANQILVIEGFIASSAGCPEDVNAWRASLLNRPAIRTKGAPELVMTIVLREASGNAKDGFAEEGECLNAVVRLSNIPPGDAAAENLTLTLELFVQPGIADYKILNAACGDSVAALAPFPVFSLGVNESAIRSVRFKYSDLLPNQTQIFARATRTRAVFGGTGFETGEETAFINIKHDCYARPRTFIPAVQNGLGGLRFKPDDGQEVYILDLDGNKVWEGTTDGTWDGRTRDGRALPPGTYVWSIKGLELGNQPCRGTIVLLR